MATDPHAEVMQAAAAAMAAFQARSAGHGFPGAVQRKPRSKRKPKEQVSLWEPSQLGEPGKKARTALKGSAVKEPPVAPVVLPDLCDSQINLIQRALRASPRPWPKFERSGRMLDVAREVVLIDDAKFVVRTQFGLSSVYCLFVNNERSHDVRAANEILGACPEAKGTVWRGCVVVGPSGPSPDDLPFLRRWLLQQVDREAMFRRHDPRAWRTRS